MFDCDEEDLYASENDLQNVKQAFQQQFGTFTSTQECLHSDLKKFVGKEICPDCGYVKCLHPDVHKDESGIFICKVCNEELNPLDFQQEWTWYGASDNRSTKDPSRCHKTKSVPKGIRNVFKDNRIDISNMMLDIMEKKYEIVIEKTRVTRGSGRNSIIAAILFYTYQEFGEFRTAEYIRDKFNLQPKHMSSGIAKYLETFPEARDIHISPEILIPWLMKLTNIDKSHHKRILYINDYIKNASETINRSNPQSIAAAVIYFYLCINNEYKEKLGIHRRTFAEKTNLSDITITKLITEINRVCT